jgi:hypothetical protein
MSRRGPLLGLSAALVALAGCGGSSKQTSTTTFHGIPKLPTTVTTVTVGNTTTTTSTAHRAHAHRHHATSPPPPPPTTTTHASAPAARIPATYTISASGTLSPPTVAAPAGYDVQLTLISRAGRASTVVIVSKTPLNLVVPAGGKTFAFLKKPPKGTYRIDVDGQQAGTLVIGAAPGP